MACRITQGLIDCLFLAFQGMAACEAYLASKGEHKQAMGSRCWQAEVLPAAAAVSVRQLITAAESGNTSSSRAVWGSPGPDAELPDRHCSWSRQQPELSVDCLLHTSHTAPPSPTLSPRPWSAATQHRGTSCGMSEYDRGATLPSRGMSHKVAHPWGGMDTGLGDATFQGREPAPESMLPEGAPLALELCHKVNRPHCLISRAERLSSLVVHVWTAEGGLPRR